MGTVSLAKVGDRVHVPGYACNWRVVSERWTKEQVLSNGYVETPTRFLRLEHDSEENRKKWPGFTTDVNDSDEIVVL